MENMSDRFATLLVDACRDSMRRCRWILSAVSIASLAVFVTCWNVYFSWLRSIVMKNEWGKPETVAESQKRLLDMWVDSGYLSVPIIGVKLHISDAAFLGSIALAILTLWLFYAMRRQNHLIGRSLRMATRSSEDVRLFIYYGLTSYNIFTTITTSDFAISTIDYKDDQSKVFGVRAAFNGLFYLPALSILFIIFCDVCSVTWLASAFRSDHSP